MLEKKLSKTADPDFFPENVEFLGFIGGWDCAVGIDTVQNLFYLIRTSELDYLEVVARYSGRVLSRNCVASIPRHGSRQEAAVRLLGAYVRARVHYDFPVPPYQRGLLTSGELENTVAAVVAELERNSRAADEEQRRREAPIIKAARELGLNPRPAGHDSVAWIADCPRRSHSLMISPSNNEFGCGYCRQKGGPAELQAFCDSVRRRDRPV